MSEWIPKDLVKLSRGTRVVKAGKLLLLVQEQGEAGPRLGCSSGNGAGWSDWLMDGCEVQKCRRGEVGCLA